MLLVKEFVFMHPCVLHYRVRDDSEFMDGDGDVNYSEILWDGWVDFVQCEDS